MSPFDPGEPPLPPHLEGLLRELRYHADPTLEPVELDGATWKEAWRVSQRQLAQGIGLSERQVRRQVAELIDLGWVRVLRRGGHQRKATSYLVRDPAP